MPELPDVTIYLEALRTRITGQPLERLQVNNPFVLRTVDPTPEAFAEKRVLELIHIGKRIAIGFEGDLWGVIHLMIAGRLHWKTTKAASSNKSTLAQLLFPTGQLSLTEAGSQRRASLHLFRSLEKARQLDAGGIDVLQMTFAQFKQVITCNNHTIKRILTDPHCFSGIGNAYSDEILHAARLSPIQHSQKLNHEELKRLFHATKSCLKEWIERLRQQAADQFPEHVTAFRPEMAVHGRFGLPCPVCQAPVQRIRYADNETNYCARCQTAGQVLADRSLSRLLKSDWPRSIDEWEGSS